MAKTPQPQDNHLLAALSPEAQSHLFPYLQLVPLKLRSIMYDTPRTKREIYFPADSIVTMQYMLEDGSSSSLAIVGNEGMVGINWFLAEKSIPKTALVQSAGYAYCLPEQQLRKEISRNSEMMMLILRYTQAVITQIAQTAICNRHHSISQQLSRWLLMSLDRIDHTRLTMTHEYIADLLGVRRESVSDAAKKLKQMGAVSYSRGLIDVTDRAKLEETACECYRVVKKETALLLDYLPQNQITMDPKSIPVRHLKLRE